MPVSAKEGGIRPPSQVQAWVGWVINARDNARLLERKKCESCQSLILDTLQVDSAGTLLARDLAAAAGPANRAAEVFLQGGRRRRHVWASLNAANAHTLAAPQRTPSPA